jgi:hypothetical protein
MNALPHRIGATFLLLMLVSGCASPNLPPTPVPPEAVGVFTPADLRARVDSTPDSHKIVISDEVVAWFPDRVNSMANWIGIAFIYHLPTMSSIVFDYEGNVDSATRVTIPTRPRSSLKPS